MKDISKIIEQFVDLLMPELTQYETSLYIFFLRQNYLKGKNLQISLEAGILIQARVGNNFRYIVNELDKFILNLVIKFIIWNYVS